MLRVTIELLPHGDESRKETIGIIDIINDGSGDPEIGNYAVRLHKTPKYAKRPGVWRRGKVTGFPRLVLGPYDLLCRALAATVGDRNKMKTEATP